ncbi:MAG: molecular chaperone TorD family protein [Chloroflexota bacterium]
MPFSLLSHLWLHEPDADAIARAVTELGLPPAEPAELASAYADVFLLNVYPYSTAFTVPSGELNGPGAQRMAALYEAQGYCPSELNSVGAPDHLGLCLRFLAHLSDTKCLQDT